MSNDFVQKRYQVSAADTPNIDSAGATSEFIFAEPVIITKCGIIATTAVNPDNSVALTATLSRRVAAGTVGTPVTLGVFTMLAANATDLAIGKGVFKVCAIVDADGETAEDYSATQAKSRRFEAPNSNITPPITGDYAWLILPGQSFVMTLDTNAEADSGAVVSFVEYISCGWGGPQSGGSGRLVNMTRDTSND